MRMIWKQADLAESIENRCNPCRGFYHVYTFALAEMSDKEEWKWSLVDGESLALVLLDIGAAARRSLTGQELAWIEEIFRFFAASRRDMIVRVVYDREGKGMEHEPYTIETVKRHMRELAPLFVTYAPYILTLQGLFVGSWGEMHTSKFLGEADMKELYRTLKTATEGSCYLSVRKPAQQRLLGATDQRDSTVFKGIGLFDDGILGSPTHLGTFAPEGISETPDGAWTRERELAYEEMLCSRVPNGGEAVAGEELPEAEAVCRLFQRMHLTYLNSVHDRRMLDHFAQTDSGVEGMSLYDYIGLHLGYRFLVKHVTFCERRSGFFHRTKEACFRITIENTGFAPCYESFRLFLAVGNEVSPMEADLRGLAGGGSATYEIPLTVQQREEVKAGRGGVKLFLKRERLSDAVWFANQGAGEELTAGFLSGQE